jgi:hypothetical protein
MREARERLHLCSTGAREDRALPVLQNHLLTFEQEWTDQSEGRTLPSFVTGELHDFHVLPDVRSLVERRRVSALALRIL